MSPCDRRPYSGLYCVREIVLSWSTVTAGGCCVLGVTSLSSGRLRLKWPQLHVPHPLAYLGGGKGGGNGVVHRAVCLSTPQLSLVLIAPTHEALDGQAELTSRFLHQNYAILSWLSLLIECKQSCWALSGNEWRMSEHKLNLRPNREIYSHTVVTSTKQI